ncbi:hypothetical protein GCM10027419_32720 [Pandoraea terrae]
MLQKHALRTVAIDDHMELGAIRPLQHVHGTLQGLPEIRC